MGKLTLKNSLGMKFLLTIGGIVTLTITILFLFIFWQSERAIIDQLDSQSRALLQQILITRAWVSDHSGVYLKKAPGVIENPYLPGTTVTDSKGSAYIFHNPAYVTRLLSEYADREGLYSFHITSLKPINPTNAPSPSEEDSLREFEKKGFEATRDGITTIINEDGMRFYQRTIPLRVEHSCMACHEKQGYKEGDIRGGLSVTIPMTLTDMQLFRSRTLLGIGGAAFLGIVGISIYLLLQRLILSPIAHLHQVASRLVMGDYSARADLKTGDELEELAKTYNSMTTHIIDSYRSMVKTLAAAVEMRDPYTAGHVERVSRYAKAIAEEMDIEPRLIHQIEMGAILHDIGKIGIPDGILLKPGSLNDIEGKEMRSHPLKGKEIISSSSDFSSSVQAAILYHHEHFDGKGYPFGLKGNEIPIGDRIISVADAFDAMVTDRPYRKGMPWETAVSELKKRAGMQFDPKAVDAFLKAYEKGVIMDVGGQKT